VPPSRVALRDKAVMSFALWRLLLMAAPPVPRSGYWQKAGANNQTGARMLPILSEPAGSHRLQGCHAFCRKKQKSRQPLAASSSQPPSSSFGTPGLAPVATLAGRLAEAWPVSATRCAHCSHCPAFLPQALFPACPNTQTIQTDNIN
jgi:hypothetical protein